MKTRTATSITVSFTPIREGSKRLVYSVETTGIGSEHAVQSCNVALMECTVSNLSPGRQYHLTMTACINDTPPKICSDVSDPAVIKTVPEGKKLSIYTIP